MAGIVKQVAGVLVGVILCILIIMAVEMVGHRILSGDSVFMAPVLAYLLAAAIGGITAIKVAGQRRWWLPGSIAAFLAFGVAVNLTALDHPAWFAPAAAVALAIGLVTCWRLTGSR
ncbi:hypothetical protein CHU95_00720 [Niveispirillum lacus]|uniref:Integral membrane protein n=1 Tax=Niveispirillum lacus TaxID=1981099 RepID=A0A255Z838_9PROT|nr:hypothetical protein [Niveispirillum lacus]OYQ37717.1 hypothetical protein CHU95_00720 [Niveispirillum lacus]